MVSERVHTALLVAGGWMRAKDLIPHLRFDARTISNSLGKLRRKGAVQRRGNTKGSEWLAMDVAVMDNRRFNGPKEIAIPKRERLCCNCGKPVATISDVEASL